MLSPDKSRSRRLRDFVAAKPVDPQAWLDTNAALYSENGEKCGPWCLAACLGDSIKSIVVWPIRLLYHFGAGVAGFGAWVTTTAAFLLILYVVSQPLLYGSMYHEEFIHKGVGLVELTEESLNTGVQLANTAMDIARPAAPLWNFGCAAARCQKKKKKKNGPGGALTPV